MNNKLQITLYDSDLQLINKIKKKNQNIFEGFTVNQIVRYIIQNYDNNSELITLNYIRNNITDSQKIKFGNFIYNWRKENNYSLNEASILLKVSKVTVFNWERGTIPNIQNLKTIENVCDIKFDNLKKGK